MSDLALPASPGPAGPRPAGPRLTRRQLILAGIAGGASVAAGTGYGLDRLLDRATPQLDAPAPRASVARFHSRPDLVPTATRLVRAGGASPGHLLVGPDRSGAAQPGRMILDARGDLVSFDPVARGTWVTNFRVQSYRGRPALTWWEGKVSDGYGAGEAVIADSAYRQLARVRAANGRTIDLHEFQLTDRGTALFTCTPARVRRDLSGEGGPSDAIVLEGIWQEVTIPSGRLVREWRSLDHVAPSESYRSPSATFDYLHPNSLAVMDDGDILMSARHTWTVYKLDRESGAVVWRMGGKRSDFAMGRGAQYAWQHDAQPVSPHEFTIFDDGYDGVTKTHSHSRGLVLGIDQRGRRAIVRHAYVHPDRVLTSAMGSVQSLPNRHAIVNFGTEPYTTEFSRGGRVLADLRMPSGQQSYRGFRQAWRGTPSDAPAATSIRDRSSGRATVYASWNGATEVRGWALRAGARRSELRTVRTVRRDGFETAIPIGTETGFAQVVALDASGHRLGEGTSFRV